MLGLGIISTVEAGGAAASP